MYPYRPHYEFMQMTNTHSQNKHAQCKGDMYSKHVLFPSLVKKAASIRLTVACMFSFYLFIFCMMLITAPKAIDSLY